jgi:hypothetical protein
MGETFKLCERGDSNPQSFRNWILSPARIPIPPLSRGCKYIEKQTVMQRATVGDATYTGKAVEGCPQERERNLAVPLPRKAISFRRQIQPI